MSSLFLALCRRAGMPEPTPELRFAPPRRFRFDWAWPEARVALEVEGAVWTSGRHTRGSGFLKDVEKYNLAASLGWLVFRTTPQQLTDLALVRMVATAVRERNAA